MAIRSTKDPLKPRPAQLLPQNDLFWDFLQATFSGNLSTGRGQESCFGRVRGRLLPYETITQQIGALDCNLKLIPLFSGI